MERQQDQLGMSLGRIKGKADDLKNRINEFLKDIHGKILLQQQNGQSQYFWPELLEQYSVLGDQLSSLASSLTDENGSMLNHFVVIPQIIDPSQPERVPDLFRTKTLPEMEDFDQEMLNQCPPEKRQKVSDRISKHQRICEDIHSKFEESCSQLEFSTSFDPLTFDPNHSILKTLLSAIATGTNVKIPPSKQSIPPSSSPPLHSSSSLPLSSNNTSLSTSNALSPNLSSVSPSLNPSSSIIQPINTQLNPNLQHIPQPNNHQTPLNIVNQPSVPVNMTAMNQRIQGIPAGRGGPMPNPSAPKGSANPVKMSQPGQTGVPPRPINFPSQVARANSIYSALTVAQKQELLTIHQTIQSGTQLRLSPQQNEHYNSFKIILAYKQTQQKHLQQQQQLQQQ